MGSSQKPVLIILHGWGLSGEKFDGLVSVLKQHGFRAVAPDFPGFGKSPIPDRPWTLSDYAQFLEEFISKHTYANVVLIGHSFGGRVSLKFLASKPKNVVGVILTGTPGYTPVARSKLALFIAIAKIGNALFSLWPFTRIADSIRRWYYWVVGAREFYRAQGSMRQTFKNVVQEDLTGYFSAIAVPSLLVWGQTDEITPLWIAKKMKEKISGSTLRIVENVGHGLPYRDPVRFYEEIQSFLRSL